jgi:hypothetical protein
MPSSLIAGSFCAVTTALEPSLATETLTVVRVDAAVAPGKTAGEAVAEDPQSGADVGVRRGDRPCQLGQLLPRKQLPAEERPEERRNIVDRGDHPAVAPHGTAEVLHRSEPGGHPLRPCGAVARASEVEAANDPARDDPVEAPTRRLLDDQAEENEVGVGVGDRRAGLNANPRAAMLFARARGALPNAKSGGTPLGG